MDMGRPGPMKQETGDEVLSTEFIVDTHTIDKIQETTAQTAFGDTQT